MEEEEYPHGATAGTTKLVKLRFPPSYPLQSKTLPLDFKLTAAGAVQQVSARLFKNFKISTSDVGLCVTTEPTITQSHPTSPKLRRQESSSSVAEISWNDFKKSPSFPFFQDDLPLEYYRSIINSIEFVDFKEKAQLPRLKILGFESAAAIGAATASEPLLSTTDTQPLKLRIAFPPTYPVIAKTFLFSNELTITQAITQIATQLNFAAATTLNIGLRPPQSILKTFPDNLLQIIRSNGTPDTYPFFNPNKTLKTYEEVLAKLDTLEYAYLASVAPAATEPSSVEDSVAEKVLIPIMWRRPDKEGDLYKIATKNILNRAVKRYFLLQKDKLFIFKDRMSLERPIASIFLTECTTITKLDEKFKGRDFVLRIEENYSDEKVYYFSGDSESEIDAWVSALQKATTKKTLPLQVKHTAHINNRRSVDMTSLFSPGDPSQIFRDLVQLGAGGFSSVWSGIDSRNHQKVVIKLVKVTKVTFKYILQEIIHHKNFKHPNIVDFIDAFYVPSTQQIWVVLELMSGGDLGKRVSPTNPLKETEISRILKEILKALQYMHSLNKVHRDIKSDNILFSADGTRIKLADFGFSTKINGASARVQSIVGTLHFMAPEILLGQTYTTAIDIWALGVLAIEMADGVPPNFMCRDITETRAFIQKQGAPKLREPRNWSPEFNSFISSCLRMEASERPTADQLLSHPFISGQALTRRRPVTAAPNNTGNAPPNLSTLGL